MLYNKSALSLIALFFVSFTLNAQYAFQRVDINSGTAHSRPSGFVGIDSLTYFQAEDGTHGRELWVSNGTVAGTKLVKDIYPGIFSSEPIYFTGYNGKAYFAASDGTNGTELWVTDGTTTGTQMLKNIRPGAGSSNPRYFTVAKNLLFFSADDGTHGIELWVTDGTANGTMLVKDIRTGSASSNPGSLRVVNNTIIFGAYDGSTKNAIWTTDGTTNGTNILTLVGSSNATGANLRDGVMYNGKYYFSADGGSPVFHSLWETDGTANGTKYIRSFDLVGGIYGMVTAMVVINNKMFFGADSTGISAHTDREPWISDGTANGTHRLKNIHPNQTPFNTGGTIGFTIISVNDSLAFFVANDSVHGHELFVSDGTANGTKMVKDLRQVNYQGANIDRLTSYADKCFFTARDTHYMSPRAWELYVSDGTTTGTQKVLAHSQVTEGIGNGSYQIGVGSGSLFVGGFFDSTGHELWIVTDTTVNTPPAITTQPVSNTTCSGANTSFTVLATGTALTYQWQVNSGTGWSAVPNTGIYSNPTSAMLSLTGVTMGINSYQYRCIVNGAYAPSDTSDPATITISTLPTITTQPTSSTICAGANTSFTTVATGTALTYQWQVNSGSGWSGITNGGIYSNATTGTLNLTAASIAVNSNQYRCVVGGACTPGDTSNIVTLTINGLPTITTQPANSTICSGANTSFTAVATGSALTYQWEVNNGSGWSSITNGGIYSNATTGTLNLTAAGTAVNNNQYRCVVSGTCSPGTTSNSATLTINTAPVVTTQPVSSTICSGGNTSFTVVTTGTGLTYQWEANSGNGWGPVSNTGIYSNANTSTLNLTGAGTGVHNYQYRCVVTGTCWPWATSNAATLTVNTAPAITSGPFSSTICENSNTNFSVTATGTALTYQWQVNSGSGWSGITNGGIYSNATTRTLNLTAATTSVDNYQYRCVVSGACASAVTSSSATLTINTAPAVTMQPANSTICSGSNTSFTAVATGTSLTYQWQVNSGSGWSNITNGGIYSNAGTGTLNLTAATSSVDNYQYRCVVNGTCSPSVTSNAATLSINTAPDVTMSAHDTTVCQGSDASFAISATGTGIVYQWQEYNGVSWSNLTNAGIYSQVNSNTLKITGATNSLNNNQYRCIVSGTCAPNDTSIPSQIIVSQLLVASVLIAGDTDICTFGSVKFTATPVNGGNPSYQWKKNGANTGITTPTYTSGGFVDGDIIACEMTTDIACPVLPVVLSKQVSIKVKPLLLPTVDAKVSFNGGNSFTFTALPVNEGSAPTYQWFKNGHIVSGAVNATYVVNDLSATDLIYVEMSSSEQCLLPGTVPAQSRKVTTAVSAVKDIFSYLSVYPNPNAGSFTVKGNYTLTQNAEVSIIVMNALGQKAYTATGKITNGKLEERINLNSDVAPGVYIINISAEGKNDYRRVTINK